MRADAPVEAPFKQRQGLPERQRLERQQAVVLEAHLGRDPPPQAAWALQGDVEVGVGLLSADFVVGVEQGDALGHRSEEHTSELQSLMRISYAVFCLKKKKTNNYNINTQTQQCNN